MLRAIILDFDGLILDTELPKYAAWCELYESHGQTLDLETWCLAVGTRNGFDPYTHLEDLIQLPLDRAALRLAQRQRSSQLVAESPLLPGIAERLAEARGLALGIAIASSSDYADVYPHLEKHQIAASFHAVVCAATDGLPAKPDPALYLEALRRLAVAPDEALAFEDSYNGLQAAKSAGIRCVAVPNTVTAALDFSAADLVLPSMAAATLDELARLLAF